MRRVAQEAAGAEVRAGAAKLAVRWAREQQEAAQQAAVQQAEALAQQAAVQQAMAVAQEAAAQEVAAQQATAQQAAAQQAAVQQAAVQQAAAQALARQQQQAHRGGQQWQQKHQCGGHNQMQGGAGGVGGPPPLGGPVCIICQRTPVEPVSGLCAVCLHQRGGVLGVSPRCAVGGCMNLAQPGDTLCTVHLGGAAQPEPQQQPQAAAGEEQLAAIFRQNAEQIRELKQMESS